jgi:hypothetical protein
MLDDLVELLYRYPSACRAAGRGLSSVAGFALTCGAYAHVGTTAASIATGMAGQPPVTQAAQLLPGMWTWWVPESFPGVLFYGAVFAAGALLALTAKKVQRQLRAL